MPITRMCDHHDSPLDYLWASYCEPASDLIVWAPRGGGKTRLAAVATLLDLIHKPPAQVRILGGSLEQSLKMWEYLLPDLQAHVPDLLLDASTARRVRLVTGSGAAAIAQSQRAVRGLRVQKMRCDEVELFDPAIWQAAQLTTRSLDTERGPLRGSIEAISTFHSAGGLMGQIIDGASERNARVLKWCVLDVLARCEPDRDCASCPLLPECQGRAKTRASGFMSIDDAIALKRRVCQDTWESEMLCIRPSVRGRVFPSFNPALHVRETLNPSSAERVLSLAIDFGFANPFVCLWIETRGSICWVIDEYVQPQQTMDVHLSQIQSRAWGKVVRVSCDPAGAGRNDQTASSNAQMLRRAGYVVRHRSSRIVDGLEQIRGALLSATGETTLYIHPRCRRLIQALKSYRYPETGGELPIKDGTHDHLIDALRYHYANQEDAWTVRKY